MNKNVFMRIKEFRIYRYGPLTDSKRIVLGDFNLFYGKNEEGKTLTIDGLVRLLLSKKATKNIFERIDRVDDNPEGYVIIENEGKSIKFPESGDLTSLISLSPQEWRNLFIIRNSDLSISKEETFYTGVTDKLTGLKSKRIMVVKDNLRDIGKLTRADSSGKLSDRESDEKLLSRVNRAKGVKTEIERLKAEAEEEGLDEIEENIEDMNEELEKIGMELSNLEDTEKREKYEKGLDAIDELKESLKKLKGLESFKEEEERNFRDLERDIRIANEEIEKLTKEIKIKEIELKNVKEVKEEEKRGLRIMSERKKKIEEVEVDIRRHKEWNEKFAQIRSMVDGIKPLTVVSLFLFVLSLIGTVMRPLPIFIVFSLLFFILPIYAFIQRIRGLKVRTNLAKLFEEIRFKLTPIGISSDFIEGILSLIQEFKEKLNEEERKLQDLEGNENILAREIERINKKIDEYEEEKRKFEKDIEEIKSVSGVKNLDEYRKKLDRKQEIERITGEYGAILKSLFGTGTYSVKKELIEYWERTVFELGIYKNKAVGIKYSDTEKRKLQEKRDEIERTKGEIEKRYINWQDSLKQIEREAQDILRSEVYCSTLKELSFVYKRLQNFACSVEKNAEDVLSVISIFEEIEKEEERKISRFFGKNSSISKYFSRITDGLYTAVDIDTETQEKRVFVRTKNKNILDVLKLSGGAYDQLYLSIRLALGGELLKSGFFIMDDPFIKSDKERLQRQMAVLRKIVEEGWQILYFTAKDEVQETLKRDISDKKVNLIETNWIII